MHNGPASCFRVHPVRSKCLQRFLVNHLPNRGKVESRRHQIDSISEVRQPPNPKVPKHHLYIIKCIFIPMHDLPLLNFQQHSTYGIISGHVNACLWHQDERKP